jgi:hypothetical protein
MKGGPRLRSAPLSHSGSPIQYARCYAVSKLTVHGTAVSRVHLATAMRFASPMHDPVIVSVSSKHPGP